MFDNLNKLVDNGMYVWFTMAAKSLLHDYSWLGVGVIILPLFRRIVNIFRNLY